MDNDSGRRIYDVGRPDQPPPTSKPIIVGHRPVMPDPMLRRDYRNLHPRAPEPSQTPSTPPAVTPQPLPPPQPTAQRQIEPQEPPQPKHSPPFAKYAPRPIAQPPPAPAEDFTPPTPPSARPASAMPPEDLTVHIPAGKVSVWRSPLTWLGSALLVLAIAFLVFIALRLAGK